MAEDIIPNHVCIDEGHPHFWKHFRHLGVKIDGKERLGDVHEFNVAKGWAMVRVKNDIGQFKIDPNNAPHAHPRFRRGHYRARVTSQLKVAA